MSQWQAHAGSKLRHILLQVVWLLGRRLDHRFVLEHWLTCVVYHDKRAVVWGTLYFSCTCLIEVCCWHVLNSVLYRIEMFVWQTKVVPSGLKIMQAWSEYLLFHRPGCICNRVPKTLRSFCERKWSLTKLDQSVPKTFESLDKEDRPFYFILTTICIVF